MTRRTQGGWKLTLLLLSIAIVCPGALAQWQIGEQVLSPPTRGLYYSMRLGTNAPPFPFLPCDVTVYFLGTRPGSTHLVFAFDDRDRLPGGGQSAQTSENGPPMPGEGGGGGSGGSTNEPPAAYGIDYGTNLYLLIGTTNVATGSATNREAWLVLTNTHSGKFYQLQSRPRVVDAPWGLGEIRQDTGGANAVPFSNAPTIDPAQRFFRGVEGDTAASVVLDPDYNLAVEPATNGGSGQVGKFRVFLSPTVSHNVTIVYQMGGAASNGMDYSSLSGTATVEANTSSATIDIHPLYDTLPEFDESLTLTLVLTNGYLVEPKRASATMKIYDPRPEGMAVAIHDSGWTKLHGLSTTNWNYFVMPESVKEALRSDGTPYAVVSDLDLANGVLLANGVPKYPILISLAAEVIRDEEIAALTNYVAAGGFVLVGSSSFTRYTNGIYRPDFALTSQMGISCGPSAANWYADIYLLKLADHRLVSHLPDDSLVWRMPTYSDEISWGTCANQRTYSGPHPIWQVSLSGATELARGDYCTSACSRPYVTVKQYGNGYFIYDAALQPLIGHGGIAPGMYAYLILRRAIEWAFESAQRPLVRLSPWPFQYDAAFMVRHDLENSVPEIAHLAESAEFEQQRGARGDYYFCTGAITNDGVDTAAILSGLQTALSTYGATIAPHNGGLPNPRLDGSFPCYFAPEAYQYFHWGPDEALDLPGGYAYASNSLAISFSQIETWLTGYQDADFRIWVAPYFNATREDSYRMQEQLGIKITGDQKLTPFPHWTLSTQMDSKRYAFLSEPVSDWFVGSDVAQVLGPWQDHAAGPGSTGQHSSRSMRDAVDFYYSNGFLINFYSHSLSATTGADDGEATPLTAEYVEYCTNGILHPRIWSANAKDVYSWWLPRNAAEVTATYAITNGQSFETVAISGAQSTNTAVEFLFPSQGAVTNLQVLTNLGTADTNSFRTSGQLLRVWVGTSVTNVQAQYVLIPKAQDDSYTATQGQTLTLAAPGVLENDWGGHTWPDLAATNASIPQHGSLTLTNNGGFSYTPQSTFAGRDCFTYQAKDQTTSYGSATVTLFVMQTNALFTDDFGGCTGGPGGLVPWQARLGKWGLTNAALQGTSPLGNYGYCYLRSNWTDYSIAAKFQFPTGAFGGGLGGRLDPARGTHYAAWIYPEGSPGVFGEKVLALMKFSDWETWDVLATAPLVSVGTTSHTVKLSFNTNHIDVYYDDLLTPMISISDTDSSAYLSGGIIMDMWTYLTGYTMTVDDVTVTH